MTASADNATGHDVFERLAAEFLERRRQGEPLAVDRFAEQYPEHATQLKELLPTLLVLEEIAPSEPDAASSLMVQGTLGDYRIQREIGRGGMGIVYEAEQLSLHRKVALKVLPFAALIDDRALQRFKNEVSAIASLEHANIVDIYGVACDRGVHHYAMRLIRGHTIADALKEIRGLGGPDQSDSSTAFSPVPPDNSGVARNSDSQSSKERRKQDSYYRSVARVIHAIGDALHHAHENGIIHRDVKPSNLMIDQNGKAWITDFGLARASAGTQLTNSGDLLGTAAYMSPEQLNAKRIVLDHRTDIYSLGVTLYEMLTLRLPFDSENRQDLFRQILSEEPEEPRRVNSNIPNDMETIALKAIEKNPADRYQSALELAEDLQRYLDCKPIIAKKTSAIGRLLKLAARHQVAVVATGFSLLTTIVSLAASLVLALAAYRREADEHRRAEDYLGVAVSAQQLAESNTIHANAVSEYLLNGVLVASRPDQKDDWGNPAVLTVPEVLLRAEEDIGQSLASFPLSEAAVRYSIGKALLDFNLPQAAQRFFRSAHQLSADNLGLTDVTTLEAAYELSRSLLLLGNDDEAYAVCWHSLQRLATSEPSLDEFHPLALCLSNQLSVVTRDADQAASRIEQIIEVLKKSKLDKHYPIVLNDAAMHLLCAPQSGEVAELALEFAKAAVSAEPGLGEFYRTLALAEYATGNLPNAIKSLSRTLDFNGGIRINPMIIPRSRLDKEKQLLLNLLEAAIAQDLRVQEIYVMRANLFARSKNWEAAAKALKQGILNESDSHSSVVMLALVEWQMSEDKSETHQFERIVDKHRSSMSLLCSLYPPNVLTDYEEVLAWTETCYRRFPQHGRSKVDPGVALYRSGEWQACINWFQGPGMIDELTQENPDNPYPDMIRKFVVSMALHRLGQLENASQLLLETQEALAKRTARSDLGDQWTQWIVCTMLQSEAKNLIK